MISAGTVSKLLKFTKLKTNLPFTVDICDNSGQKLVALRRGFTFLRSASG